MILGVLVVGVYFSFLYCLGGADAGWFWLLFAYVCLGLLYVGLSFGFMVVCVLMFYGYVMFG